jgi:sec-independent protein translocase protein TatC
MPPDEQPENETRMSISNHLDELRSRLILALVGVVVAACLALAVGRHLIAILYVPLANAQMAAGLQPQTYALSVQGPFMIYLKVSLIAGIILASPWIVYQVWRFIASGLHASERRVALVLIPFSVLMTVIGMLFMYFIMLPVCLWFFLNFATSYPDMGETEPTGISLLLSGREDTDAGQENAPVAPDDPAAPKPSILPTLTVDPPEPIEGQIWLKVPENVLRMRLGDHTRSLVPATTNMMSPLIEIGLYISFVTMLALGIGVAFQLPVVMVILGWTGVVDPAWFARYRRHSVFVCFALGALLTPADVMSMIMLAAPLWGLFELGLVLMRIVYKKRQANAA